MTKFTKIKILIFTREKPMDKYTILEVIVIIKAIHIKPIIALLMIIHTKTLVNGINFLWNISKVPSKSWVAMPRERFCKSLQKEVAKPERKQEAGKKSPLTAPKKDL